MANRSKTPKPWPDWASAVADYRLPADRGVGDTVEHTIGLFGSAAFNFWFEQTFGHNRRCPKCPAQWNARYPYQEDGRARSHRRVAARTE